MNALASFKRLYSTSSKKWISRQARDPYCKLAKANQYRARSAFKLIQINEKYRIIQRNDVIIDCGAAPGGWTQVAAEKVTKKGLVIGVDLLHVDPIPNAHLIKGNFMQLKTQDAVHDILQGRSVDLVCSDMAPSFSGNHTADHARSMELCESALAFAEKVLSPGGSFVAKFLMGGTEHEFRKRLQAIFVKVKTEKPDASRKQSTEVLVMARGKGKKYAKSKKGSYKRDHSYIDFSENEEDDNVRYNQRPEDDEDGPQSDGSRSDSDNEHKEEDFISLNTEVDTRSRQQRRSEKRAELKRKRSDDSDSDDNEETLLCYPWMELMESNRLKQPLSAIRLLQREVACFVQYVEPTEIEIKLRNYLVHRIRTTVQAKWPDATVSVFGSFSTTLYLPNSDIDLVVQFPPSTQIRLQKLANALTADRICHEPQVIEHASVPVIKFADTMTNLKVDIVLNSTSGLDSAEEINNLLVRYPGLRPISLIVKHLLALRALNEVFTGGLGGYAIVCLVVSFLQMHPKVASGSIDPMQNIGVLLLDFFQLYGLNFNLNETGLDVNGKGSYYDKSHITCRNGKAVFSIKDPLDPSNDIGMKSYNSYMVVRTFKFAYLSMTQKAFSIETELRRNRYKKLDADTLDNPKKASILSSFLHISTDFMKQRQLMNDVYAEKKWIGQTAADSFSFD
ncbi:hypothetical protein [Parasitella parasitica]|uniref:polynucleotide adenylyltransferase n=1 Tax=Parasitella parasitica TaxID=35722 RepID=A0A0B7NIY0_9FUNG|nr:hypothetical protein [Parasitella parasitica]